MSNDQNLNNTQMNLSGLSAPRTGSLVRETAETKISCTVTLDPTDEVTSIQTGIPFFDHMLNQLAFHGRMVFNLQADGDLEVDGHHTVEDVGITLGNAFKAALGDAKGIERYGHAIVPMDEVLALSSVDVSGRPYAVCECPFTVERIGSFETECLAEFLTGLARGAGMTLHVKIMTPGNNHHMAEAIFKSLAVAMRQAVAISSNFTGLPSTKGSL